jgi:hypothetical protein
MTAALEACHAGEGSPRPLEAEEGSHVERFRAGAKLDAGGPGMYKLTTRTEIGSSGNGFAPCTAGGIVVPGSEGEWISAISASKG